MTLKMHIYNVSIHRTFKCIWQKKITECRKTYVINKLVFVAVEILIKRMIFIISSKKQNKMKISQLKIGQEYKVQSLIYVFK